MQLNEVSRVSQLTPNGLATLSTAMQDVSLYSKTLTQEISNKIDEMPANLYADSMNWYSEANAYAQELANRFDTTIEIAAGIVSAVSPRMPWLRNKLVAASVLQEFKKYPLLSANDAAKEMGLGLNTNVAMAIKIARGESISDTLTGTKRRSFFNNIVSPLSGDSVTIDTWMVRAIMAVTPLNLSDATNFLRRNRTVLGGTGAGYIAVAEATRNVAKARNITPAQAQAAYWTAVSGSVNGGREDIN